MKDRVPLYPGRVKLTPVSGQANTYDMVRADEPTQEGDPLSKSTFLKDATAALFGLDATAVPDDALALLSRFHKGLGNEYVWEKGKNVETADESFLVCDNSTIWISTIKPAATTEDIEYSDTVSVVDGEIVLNNPSVLTVSYNTYSDIMTLVGKYVKVNSGSMSGYGGQVLYIKSGGKAARNSDYRGYYFGINSCTAYLVSVAYNFVVVSYVNSPDPAACPPAEPDGYTYKALGKLGSKVRIETGSYTGTGTYGESNPNSLAFDFEPKLVIVYPQSLNGANKITTQSYWVIFTQFTILRSDSSSNGFGESCDAPLAWGNTLTWWTRSDNSDAAVYQGNVLNNVYQYIAIG